MRNWSVLKEGLLMIILLGFGTRVVLSQEFSFRSFGNGYDYEIQAGHQILKCISNRCFRQLERTRVIDEDTYIDDDIHIYLDSLHTLKASGYITMSRRQDTYVATGVPPLTFYGVFVRREKSEVFFQIRLSLSYEVGGLLKADSIQLISEDFFVEVDDFSYKYDQSENGSPTNIPPPPPPPPPPPAMKTRGILASFYESRFVNFCNACQVRRVSKDTERKYWLMEQYVYDDLKRLNGETRRYLVKKNDLYGIITDSNQIVVPIIYEFVRVRNNSMVLVGKDGLQGVYDMNGNEVLPVIYDEVYIRMIYKNNRSIDRAFIVKQGEAYGVFDASGKGIIPIQYDEVKLFYNKYYRLEKDDKYGLVTIAGDLLLENVYEEIDFESSLHSNRWYNLINEEGEIEVIRIINKGEEFEVERFIKAE